MIDIIVAKRIILLGLLIGIILLPQGVDGDSLHDAVREGNLRIIRRLLERGTDVNVKGFLGWTPLHLAVYQKYTDVVELGLGCYRLRIDDSGDNGLYYWHTPEYGSGYFRMRDVNNDIVESFEREFGRFAVYEFAVVDMTSTAETDIPDNVISIYPNPTRNTVNILHQGMENTRVEIIVLNTAECPS